jgi:phosphate acyltransferase
MKGSDLTKEAFKLLKVSGLNFRGNIEGHELFEKPAEVVVCDGFTGNVVLKTTEAVAHVIFSWLKHELFRNPIRKLGAKLAEGALKSIRKKTNYEEYGGTPLLGVNGMCIIAHGASSPLAIKNAIRAATESIKHEINPQILRAVQSYNDKFAAAPTPVPVNREEPFRSGTGSNVSERVLTRQRNARR